ncbi:MAG: hypothetical protein AAF985_14025 [Bacteroidota bacterium]
MNLHIIIDQKGRQFFSQYNQKIILIRAINPGLKYQIICAAFAPFGEETGLSFTDSWMIEASDDPLKADSKIVFKDQIKANLGQSYQYRNDGFVTNNHPVPPSSIHIANDRSGFQALVFGLGQKMDIDDGQGMKYRSVSVRDLPFNQHFNFVPNNRLWILPGSHLSANMLLTTHSLKAANQQSFFNKKSASYIIGKYLEIDIGETSVIHFDNTLHLFKKGPLTG